MQYLKGSKGPHLWSSIGFPTLGSETPATLPLLLTWLVLQEKAKEFGRKKMVENVNAEEYLAESGGKPPKKSKKSKRSQS